MLTELLKAAQRLSADYPALSQFEAAFACPQKATQKGIQLATLPVVEPIKQGFSSADNRTPPLVNALIQATDSLHWQQTYSAADKMPEGFLDRYGWANLVSPDGPYVSDQFRLCFGYWGPNIAYPWHSHEPEEYYLVIAGGALFEAYGRGPIQAKAGELVHHQPWQSHRMTMTDQPLLVLAFWAGNNLTKKSVLTR